MKKKEKEYIFERLIEDEYNFCVKEINENIHRGKDRTMYEVTIKKIQAEWDPIVGTYLVLKRLRENDFNVHYLGNVSLLIYHKQKKVRKHPKYSKKRIIALLKQEENNTRRLLLKEGHVM